MKQQLYKMHHIM